MTPPDPGYTLRESIADSMEEEGWPSVADDVREGVPYETIVERLRDLDEHETADYVELLIAGRA